MPEKTLARLWAVSLMVLGLGGLVLNLNHLFSLRLPKALMAAIALLCLFALAVLVFASLRLRAMRRREK